MLVTHSRKPAAVMVAAVIWLAGLTACQLARHDAAPDPIVAPGQIVFVCEHGSVKSLIAASLFERAAAKRGLDAHAVSRGVSPDERVPAKIVAALGGEGFDVANFRPQALTAGDLAGAGRVVAIGVDLSMHGGVTRAPIQSWNDVPAASVDYQAARAALQRHVDDLLEEMQDTLSR